MLVERHIDLSIPKTRLHDITTFSKKILAHGSPGNNVRGFKFIVGHPLGTIKASQAVVLNEDSGVVTQRKLMQKA